MESTLKITEIFYTLQGEGPLSGKPCIFIRLWGCNLNCKWCDTKYAKDSKNYTTWNIQKILDYIFSYYPQIKYITITGGEPLLQEKPLLLLIEKLLEKKYLVSIETNGSISIKNLPKKVLKIMDIKTPSSNMHHFNYYENVKFLTKNDAIKFVIANKKDFEWSVKKCEELKLFSICEVFFSPVWKRLSGKTLAKWILSHKLPIRLNLQLHKLLKLP